MVFGALGGLLESLWMLLGRSWAVLCRFWAQLGKGGESFGKLKKSRAVHTFVDRCAFRSPARSGLIPSWVICTLDFLNFLDLYPLFRFLGRFWALLGVLGRFLGFLGTFLVALGLSGASLG